MDNAVVLIVGLAAHRRIAEVIRAKLNENEVSARIHCEGQGAQRLIEQACHEAQTAYRVIVLLTEGGQHEGDRSEAKATHANGIPIITVDISRLPKSLLSKEFVESLNVLITQIQGMLSGLSPNQAIEQARQSHLRPSFAEFQELLENARHRLEAAPDPTHKSVLDAIEREAQRAWRLPDEAAWRRLCMRLSHLTRFGESHSSPSPSSSDIPPRVLAQWLSQQVASTRAELDRRLSLSRKAGWTDAQSRLTELGAHLDQLAGDLQQIASSEPTRALGMARIALDRMSTLQKAMESCGPRTDGSDEEGESLLAQVGEFLLQDADDEEERRFAMHKRIEDAIRRSKSCVAKGDFLEARRVIQALADTPSDLRDLKENLLRQIDEAEEHAAIHKMIEDAVEHSKSCVAKGDFREARRVIQTLPDTPTDLRDLKQNLLRQIDDLENQFANVTQENVTLLEELTSIGVADAVLAQIARDNDIDMNNPFQFNALLRAAVNQVPVALRRERGHKAGQSGGTGWLRWLIGFGGRVDASTKGAVQDSSQQEVSTARGGDPFAPPAVMDRVHFSVTSPPLMNPGASHIVDVWAHLEEQRAQVIERARQEAGRTDVRIKSKGPIKVERGTILTVRLQIQDVAVNPREDTIYWEGEIGNATFSVTVKPTAGAGPKSGTARIYASGFQVARVSFVIQVGAGPAKLDRLQAKERRIRSAFASYASADQDAVVVRVQAVRKALPGLDVFFARKDLRSGEKWQERLAHEIEVRDVMYLFWSQAASRSKWVDWEWRRGLRTRGIDFIDPFPLVSPEVVAPPKELADELHFGDWELAYMHILPEG